MPQAALSSSIRARESEVPRTFKLKMMPYKVRLLWPLRRNLGLGG